MRHIARILIAALFTTGLWATAAHAANGDCRLIRGADTPTDTTDDVTVCTQDVWFHQAQTKLGNLSGSDFGADTIPSWDTTAPTASYQSGAGAGYATLRIVQIANGDNSGYEPTFQGAFTGPVDTLGVTAYLTCPLYQATGTDWPLLVRLTIDDQAVFDHMDAYTDVPIQGSDIGKVQFAITNVYAAMQANGVDLSATAQHTVKIEFLQNFWGDGHTVVFYDAAEVPSGMIFNIDPADLTGYTVLDATPQ